MKIFILVLFIYTSLFSLEVEVEEEQYLGSSYNLYVAFEPSCLSFIGNTDVINENIGVLVGARFCDQYLNDSQDYLESIYSIGTGMSLYSDSVFRDSFFTVITFNLNRTFMTDIFTGVTGDSLSISSMLGLGYQWHFKRGYILSIAGYISHDSVLKYDAKSDSNLKDVLSEHTIKATPTFLFGWRF